MWTKLTFLFAFLICGSSKAATINAASASRADVGTAYTAASHGDTVVVPSGAVSWDTKLSIAKGITLRGAGVGQTIISNNVNGDYMLDVDLVASNNTHITGFDFRGRNADSLQLINVEGYNTNFSTLRVSSNRFLNLPGDALKLETVIGVFDSNYVWGVQPGNTLAHLKGSLWNGLTKGNGSLTNATPLFGTSNFFFFENNIITCSNLNFLGSLMDSQAGARYVFRYNLVTNAYAEGHGSEASYERSTAAVEVYGNDFYQEDVGSFVTYYRGGVGLVFSNRIWNVQGISTPLKLLNNRMNDPLFAPYGGADGRNPWDVNNASNPFDTATVTSAGTGTATASAKNWTPSQWVGYTIRRTSGKAVSSVTRSSDTITVTATAHGFSTGNLVSLFGADQPEYNRLYTITVADANTFTASIAETRPTTPATGTILACLGNHFSEITANTSTQITFNQSLYVGFGPQYNLTFTAGDTFEINKVDQAMDSAGRTGGSRVADDATPPLPSGWNDQVTSAWYQWRNTNGGVTSVSFQSTSGVIRENEHFYNNIAKPGYVPFVNPHPLVSGTNQPVASTTFSIPGTVRVGTLKSGGQ